MMKNKRIIIVAGLIVAVLTAIMFAIYTEKEKKYEGYVFDRKSKIRVKDVRIYLFPADFNADEVKDYFKNDVVNPHTLRYFFFLDDRFKDSKTIDDLLQNVRDYLYSVMPSEEADKLYAVYKTYTHYQQDVAGKMKSWGTPSSPEEAIQYLHKIQEYRREVFGSETADALFGPSVMSEEYPIRRGMIVNNSELYGAEKEQKLDELKKNMWGDDTDSIESHREPLDRYDEKLKIYEKDLAAMKSEEERQAKKRQFQEALFTPDQIRRLDEVDMLVASEKKKEEDYFAQESRINNDRDLDGDEKTKRIRELQDSTFGSEADAFRRRLAVEKER